MSKIDLDEYVLVGTIGPARGLKGEVLVRPFTDYPEDRFEVGETLYSRDGTAFEIVGFRIIKNRYCLSFAGREDREAAEAVRGTELYGEIWADDEDENAFELEDLVGLRAVSEVQNQDGQPVFYGRVRSVDLGDFQDRLVVETPARGEVMVPFVEEIVTKIDLDTGFVYLDVPAGMFPESD